LQLLASLIFQPTPLYDAAETYYLMSLFFKNVFEFNFLIAINVQHLMHGTNCLAILCLENHY